MLNDINRVYHVYYNRFGNPTAQLDPNITHAWRFWTVLPFRLADDPLYSPQFPTLNLAVNFKIACVIAAVYLTYHLILTLILPTLEYKCYRYDIRDYDFLVQQGVLFRKSSAIPLHRIQHIDTHQGPIERLLTLSTLMLYTAAGVTPDGVIPGLAEEDAQQLRDELSKREGDDGV